jgi:hypothetical protein
MTIDDDTVALEVRAAQLIWEMTKAEWEARGIAPSERGK